MANILVVDDEYDLLVLVKNILKKNNHLVEILQNPLDLNTDTLTKFDLILLDVMMPGIDGFSLCKKIRSKVDCPILFLTAKTMEEDIVEGLLNGGDDYITKPFGVHELLARVEAHLRREQREKHLNLNLGRIHFNLSSNEVFVNNEKIKLTKAEYRILELLARRKGQVFSREQIYETIFGFDSTGNSSTISEHIKNIRAKFQKYEEYPIETVWGIGYKWH
ncbi:TPA: response regulator transcription factor [Streptococcus suis]|uniref:response regulator transcription factor n=1 Tax=Streptococcus pluranimalium TaxID=82348 RepID=UPI0024158899|nr:response regulator transcription factor [Streptococcus pluranimalium]WFM79216.1 response regulator transcription factor [Streptococcus pluranimalium]HEM6116294.1 response regulator transcription factor [Streptococcus suis]